MALRDGGGVGGGGLHIFRLADNGLLMPRQWICSSDLSEKFVASHSS